METLSHTDVTDITVVGAGSMGHGIAQVFATAEYDVTLVDISEKILSSARESIRESLEQLGHDPDPILGRIETTIDQESGLEGADVMVEAVPEDIELKENVFSVADQVLPDHAVLATNTSTLPVTEIAAVTEQPERVVGMHFSNPVPLIDLVEVISGEQTDEEIVEFISALSEAIGKTSVLVKKDIPGFLLNRINYAFWSEALRCVDNGEWEIETIDSSLRRLGFPMGPFEVLDFAGVDVFYMVCQALQDRDVPVNVSETHKKLFEAQKYGMKTGEGFYEYPEPGAYARVDIPLDRRYEYNPYRMIATAANVAAWLLAEDVTTRDDIDKAMQVGMSWPRGPLQMADECGIDQIVELLETLHEDSGWEQYEPHPLLVQMVEQKKLGVKTGEGFYDHDHESETYGPIEYERRDFYAIITLSRPEKYNALNRDAWNGLGSALQRADADDSVRATIIRGEGAAFCAGDDISEMAAWESVDEGAVFFEEVAVPVIKKIQNHSKPTISLVDGVATGMGCELVLLSDLAVAGERSRFGQPESTIGALPPIWLTHGITDVGKKKILELAMTGELLPASEAEEIGLINYAVSDDQIDDVARELARSTTASAPGSIESIKDIWTRVEDSLSTAWFDHAIDELTQQVHTEEGRHGLSAFLDNESPRWER